MMSLILGIIEDLDIGEIIALAMGSSIQGNLDNIENDLVNRNVIPRLRKFTRQ